MRRIAVIGAGITGLGAARMLAEGNEVVVFEAEPRLGGHARTIEVERDGARIAVDTGFIVYNEVNYPLLTALFAELGVRTTATDMSFGVSVGGLEMSGSSLAGVFAQKRNLGSVAFWRMLRDLNCFFQRATEVLDIPDDPSLGEWLAELRVGAMARDRFLVPMGAAIWSTPPGQILDMPAKTFVRFFKNHNLLGATGHHQWRTVAGGSRRYVEALTAALRSRWGVDLRTSVPVRAVEPTMGGRHAVVIEGHGREVFDEIVFACHADTTRKLIAAPTDVEWEILSAFEFRDNHAVLHSDESFMPKARAAWASWVFTADGHASEDEVAVTYWMNRLQGLPGRPLLITLNPGRSIAEAQILDRHTFRHPVLSRAAVAAQARLPEIQGRRGLWFAGAWTRYGFHEDGIASAAWVAERLLARVPCA